MKSSISRIVLVAILAAFPVIASAQWVGPTLAPPNGNTSSPVNLSSTGQVKVGGLTVNTGGAATGFTVPFGNVGIGTLSPSYKLDVNGSARVGANDGTGLWFAKFTSSLTDVPGSVSGMQITGPTNAHVVVDIPGNDAEDGFYVRVPTVLMSSPTVNKTAFVVKASGNVGVGIASPTAKLEVAGQVKITGGTPGAGKVLTSDATGLATWTTPSGTSQWTTSGTAIYYNTGNVGINSATPSAKLDVNNTAGTQGLRVGGNNSWISYSDDNNYLGGNTVFRTAAAGPVNAVINGATGNTYFSAQGGNVGVGLTNPAYKLDVSGSDASNPILNVVNTANSTYTPVFEVNAPNLTAGNNSYFAIGRNRSSNNQFSFGFTYAGNGSASNRLDVNAYGSAPLLSVLASGNIGIGTSNPSTNKLTVQIANIGDGIGINGASIGSLSPVYALNVDAIQRGAIGLATTNTHFSSVAVAGDMVMRALGGTGSLVLANQESGDIKFTTGSNGTNDTVKMTVKANGDVGIGTTAPGAKLEVAGQVKITGGTPGAGKVLTSDATGLATWTTPSGSSQWTTSGSNIYYTTGSVGIGTTNPTQALHVNGTSNFTGSMVLPGTGVNIIAAGTGDGASKTTYNFSLQGWWGIGLKDYSGTVHGVYDFRTGNLSTDGLVNMAGTGNNYFAGNVGIGTASPAYKLDVNGDVGGTGFYYTSDRNLKKNIQPLGSETSLEKVLKLQGVSFDWKKDGKPSVGVIAQDVEKVYPELVNTNPETGLKSVEYGNLVAPLIEAVKAQQKEIEALKADIEALKAKK